MACLSIGMNEPPGRGCTGQTQVHRKSLYLRLDLAVNLKLLLKKKMKTGKKKPPEPAPLAEEASHFRKPSYLGCGLQGSGSPSQLYSPPAGRPWAASSPSVAARTVTGTMMVTTWTWTLGSQGVSMQWRWGCRGQVVHRVPVPRVQT